MKHLWIVLWSALLVSAVYVLVLRIDAGLVTSDRLFNADALFPVALYADKGSLTKWMLPYAPAFVPDLALYFAAAPIFSGVTSSLYAYAALQLLLLTFALLFLRAEAAKENPAGWFIGVVCLLCLMIAADLHAGRLIHFLNVGHHAGTSILALACAAWLMALWRRDSRGSAWAAFTVFVGLVTASDRLFLTLFVVPAAAASILIRQRQVRIRAILSLAAGGVLGVLFIGAANASGLLFIASPDPISPATVVERMQMLPSLARNVRRYLVDQLFLDFPRWYRYAWLAGWILICAPAFALLFRSIRRRSFPWIEQPGSLFLSAFALCLLLTGTAGGLYVGLGHYGVFFLDRYFGLIYLLPFVGAAVYLRLPRAAMNVLSGIFMAAVAAWTIVLMPSDLSLAASHRPPGSECLERYAAETGAKAGIGHYWAARPINLYVPALRVDQVNQDLEPAVWISRRDPPPPPPNGYDFVLLDRMDRGLVEKKLGRPGREFTCGPLQILVYSPPVKP